MRNAGPSLAGSRDCHVSWHPLESGGGQELFSSLHNLTPSARLESPPTEPHPPPPTRSRTTEPSSRQRQRPGSGRETECLSLIPRARRPLLDIRESQEREKGEGCVRPCTVIHGGCSIPRQCTCRAPQAYRTHAPHRTVPACLLLVSLPPRSLCLPLSLLPSLALSLSVSLSLCLCSLLSLFLRYFSHTHRSLVIGGGSFSRSQSN